MSDPLRPSFNAASKLIDLDEYRDLFAAASLASSLEAEDRMALLFHVELGMASPLTVGDEGLHPTEDVRAVLAVLKKSNGDGTYGFWTAPREAAKTASGRAPAPRIYLTEPTMTVLAKAIAENIGTNPKLSHMTGFFLKFNEEAMKKAKDQWQDEALVQRLQPLQPSRGLPAERPVN